MPRLSGPEYEALVGELLSTIVANPGMSQYRVGAGARNRLPGASGYKHQIDLSLQDTHNLFLLELKHYTIPVGVSELLLIAARVQDIAAAHPLLKVTASLVSKRRPSRNVPKLATFFGVRVEVVEDLHSYGLTFASMHFLGVSDTLHLTDSCTFEVLHPK